MSMTTAHNLKRARLVLSLCLVASAACRSTPAPEEEPWPYPVTRPATRAEEVTLISADSLLFDAVVRAQLSGKDDEYPYRLRGFRYDSRPYGTSTGYPEVFAGVQGIDPTLSFPRAGNRAIRRLTENRKRILKSAGVPEGGPVVYDQCAGRGVPEPPPPRGSASAARSRKRPDVHAGCPKTPIYYLTVGLPIRGQPPGLRNVRDTRGDRVSLRGDVWTALVDVYSAGPDGWSKSQYAWLFKRNDSGRPVLESTILVGVVE
jgi:hypothetical protein